MASPIPFPSEGEVLDQLELNITAECVRAYADAASDHNPIHIDSEFAATTPFGGTIAHGMLLLAYVSRLLTRRFGSAWIHGGTLDARFRVPAKVGSSVRVGGVVKSVTMRDGSTHVECNLQVADSEGQALVTATAVVIL